METFSVITICKDNLKELEKTYSSLISQSTKDYEWIVIDGNSNDGIPDWLEENDLARWVSEPDKGIYDAMNKGIKKAQGRYMIFMNSGDCFASDEVLEKTKFTLENENFPDFAFGDSIDISEDNQEFYRKAKNHKKNWMGMITQHQAMFFKKNSSDQKLYSLSYPLSGDYAFISKVLSEVSNDNIFKLNFPICKFSMGGVNEEHRYKAIKEDYNIRKKIIKLSIITNKILFTLHYIHAFIKKSNPASRFVRHKSVVNILPIFFIILLP